MPLWYRCRSNLSAPTGSARTQLQVEIILPCVVHVTDFRVQEMTLAACALLEACKGNSSNFYWPGMSIADANVLCRMVSLSFKNCSGVSFPCSPKVSTTRLDAGMAFIPIVLACIADLSDAKSVTEARCSTHEQSLAAKCSIGCAL